MVRGRQVRLAVAVQVADRDRVGTASGCVVELGGEGAVALVQQHGDGVLRRVFATARSGLPSPFRSPIATEKGRAPVAIVELGRKVPSPLLSSTETVSAPRFAVARSGLPSPFRSPIATESGGTSSYVAPRGGERRRRSGEQRCDAERQRNADEGEKDGVATSAKCARPTLESSIHPCLLAARSTDEAYARCSQKSRNDRRPAQGCARWQQEWQRDPPR